MGVRFPSVYTNTILGSPALAAETIILTTPPISLPLDNATVYLLAFLNIVVGASGNKVTMNLRRGASLTSTLITAHIETVTAGNNYSSSHVYFDSGAGVSAGVQYTLSCTVNAATGATTVIDTALIAFVL